MQLTNIFSFAACLALVHALPTVEKRTTAEIVFHGAAGAQYSLNVPLDGSYVSTNNALSISSISSSINVKDQCTLKTVDYPPALVEGPAGTWQVGPPQTVISVACTNSHPPTIPPVKTVDIEFRGAAGAKYSLTVPLDGSVVRTNNALSISTIYTTYVDLPYCNIKYVDFTAALSSIAPNTWAVGPPQTIISIQCWWAHPV